MQAQRAKALRPLLEERHGGLLEELTETEGKGEKTKLKKGIKHCQREQTNTETTPGAKLHHGRVQWHMPLEFEINTTKGSQSNSEGMRGGEIHLVGTFTVFVLVCC